MKNLFGMALSFFLMGCMSEQGVVFEEIGYQQILEKAQKLNKPILVDVFSDG
jgi:hypothetical protein